MHPVDNVVGWIVRVGGGSWVRIPHCVVMRLYIYAITHTRTDDEMMWAHPIMHLGCICDTYVVWRCNVLCCTVVPVAGLCSPRVKVALHIGMVGDDASRPPSHGCGSGPWNGSGDPRDAFLMRMRARAALSSSHGRSIEHMSMVQTAIVGAPQRRPASGSSTSSDATDGGGIDDAGMPAPRPANPTEQSRALQLQSELTARIRMAQANAANFSKNSATSKLLPVETIRLVPRPECIQSLGTLSTKAAGGQGAMFEEAVSFWGIWFVIAAAVRFQRPLRRKRAMDQQMHAAYVKEQSKQHIEQLKNAGLAHDTKKGARQLLRQSISQSEGSILLRQNAPALATCSDPMTPTGSTPHGRGATPISPRLAAQQQQRRSEPLHKIFFPHSHKMVGPDNDPATPRNDKRAPSTAPPTPTRPTTSKPTFEEKMELRDVRRTVGKIVAGVAASGSLAKTLSQHIHTAEPRELASYMFKALQRSEPSGPCAPPPAPHGEGPPPPSGIPQPPPRLPPVAPLKEADLVPNDVGSNTYQMPPLSNARSTPSATARQKGAGGLWTPQRTATSPRTGRRLERHSTEGSGGNYPSSPAALTQTHSLQATDTATLLSIRQEDLLTQSVVRRHAETERRNATAGLPTKKQSVTLDESNFVDVPLPKLSTASSRAYPPPTPRPPTLRRGPKTTDMERNFMRRVDTNTFHEDVCRRLQHAEGYRQRDFELKRQFLQHYAHSDDPSLTVHVLVRELSQYVDAKRKQDARIERHALRIAWFHQFYESMVERCSWVELEQLFYLMEGQIMNEFSLLQMDDFRQLFDAARSADVISLPSVQFFLCHVAAAYDVRYITFRELLELSHTPYVLQGNGECFFAHEHRLEQQLQLQAQ